MQDGLSRRAVLATGSVLTLSACLPGADDEPTRPDPDLVLRRRAARQVGELVVSYDAVIAAFPQAKQVETLRLLAGEHEAHVTALAVPAPSGAPTASATPQAAPDVPPSMAEAVRWLSRLERTAARRRTRQALRAGPDLARLLASVGASEAAHAAVLASEARG